MARYRVKRCPNCRDDFWVAISHPSPEAKELPITAYCALRLIKNVGKDFVDGIQPLCFEQTPL